MAHIQILLRILTGSRQHEIANGLKMDEHFRRGPFGDFKKIGFCFLQLARAHQFLNAYGTFVQCKMRLFQIQKVLRRFRQQLFQHLAF